ncbi:hypothetical protein O181_051668 [Austropuccinia psidii MF-1]|uniref:Uncharacterized protein n=1 Tax=Austropuccinia psidii MF-1 TaxID=1389203 RepID=A0A9Q3E1B3_9BASI|nr:hypothetical protein [Austropuccinia psidii MF-1]
MWWPLVANRGHGLKSGPWWLLAKMGPEGLMVILAFDGIWGQDWLRWVQLWFGTHLASGANGLPSLAPFDLIGVGQKGPNWPTAYRPWTVIMAHGP